MPRHYPSRYKRPSAHFPLCLQARDRAILASLASLGIATSDHLMALHFSECSRRVAQARLRRLFVAGYVDRVAALPSLVGAGAGSGISRRPLYLLNSLGRSTLRRAGVQTPLARPRLSLLQLGHDLTATDCLVSVNLALRTTSDVELMSIEHEGTLRAAFSKHASTLRRFGRGIVSDGAITMVSAKDIVPMTIHIEVVQADVRGGNRHLVDKLRRYAALNRSGYFRVAFGHERLRAVLIIARSRAHAESLRQSAQVLDRGGQLFWFAARGSFSLAEPTTILDEPAFRGLGGDQATFATLLDFSPPSVLRSS